MKKIISIIVILLSIVLIYFILDFKKNTLSESKIKIYNGNEYKLDIIKNTNTSLNYRITNNTNKEVTTTEEYYIEKYNKGKWYSYNLTVNYNDIAIIIKNNYENAIDFELDYGNLKKGKYRLIKKINNNYISDIFSIK